MNLSSRLAERRADGKPVRTALIGAGKFGSMFLSQVPTIPGLEVAAILDLDPDRAQHACRNVGWDDARIARTRFTTKASDIFDDTYVDVVVEATGNPAAGIAHALAAIEARKPIVMVNVEADALAGPLPVRPSVTGYCVFFHVFSQRVPPSGVKQVNPWPSARLLSRSRASPRDIRWIFVVSRVVSARGSARWIGISSGLWANRDDLVHWRDEHRVGMPLALDASGALFRRFGVMRVPTVLVADADGRVVRRTEGADAGLAAQLQALGNASRGAPVAQPSTPARTQSR